MIKQMLDFKICIKHCQNHFICLLICLFNVFVAYLSTKQLWEIYNINESLDQILSCKAPISIPSVAFFGLSYDEHSYSQNN